MSRAEHRIIPFLIKDVFPFSFWAAEEVIGNDLLHPLADVIHTLNVIGGMASLHVYRNISAA
jgi:hypothetical protein